MKALIVALACSMSLIGCVSNSDFVAKEAEADSYKKKLVDEQGRVAALEAKLKEYEGRTQTTGNLQSAFDAAKAAMESQLKDLKAQASKEAEEKKALEAKVAELSAKVEELEKPKDDKGLAKNKGGPKDAPAKNKGGPK